jgi:hypothetical protein
MRSRQQLVDWSRPLVLQVLRKYGYDDTVQLSEEIVDYPPFRTKLPDQVLPRSMSLLAHSVCGRQSMLSSR